MTEDTCSEDMGNEGVREERDRSEHMSLPKIVRRGEQPYVAIGKSVRMDEFPTIADRLPDLVGWVLGQGLELAGAPFFRYRTIDMDGESEVEAGVPLVSAPEPEGEIRVGVLPAGHYATVTHLGRPEGLLEVARGLREWAEHEGLEWDMTVADGVEHWGCRLESYRTNPQVEPDPANWETELAFRLADLAPGG
ncbi:GyrI-like domain-containing protein [Streptomyces scopuliridis]|uniref:GyrI-like domain-containing protein n=1 Tax=Streptomyces scopuliridis TaxID=452529 RepID=UPI0036C8BC99